MKHNGVTKFMQYAIYETQWCNNNSCNMQYMKQNGVTIIYAKYVYIEIIIFCCI